MKTNKLFLKIIIIAGGILFLPLAWIFLFSLGNMTVTASSKEDFSRAIEEKLKVDSITKEIIVLIPNSAQQLTLKGNRSRMRDWSITFVLPPGDVKAYLDHLKMELPNYTIEITKMPSSCKVYLRCTNPNLWLPLPAITVHFSQIDINEQNGKIELQTFE